MSLFRRSTLSLMASLLLCPSIGAAYTVENPSDFDIEAIHRHLSANPPNFDSAARNSSAYRSANEFDRADVLVREIDRLKQQYEALADADLIKIRLNARISDYDAEKGVFYIEDLGDGTYIPFNRYGLTFDNAAEFREWVLPVDHAREIREQVPFGNVTAVIMVRPFGLPPNTTTMVRGQITSLQLYADNNKLLHEVTLPESELRPIQRPGSEAAKGSEIASEMHNVLGVSVGLDLDQTVAQLQEQGFAHNVTMSAREGYTPTAFSTSAESLADIKPARPVTAGDDNLAAILDNQDQRAREIYDRVMEGRSGRPFLLGALGNKLDCNASSDILPSCGYVLSDADGKTRSILVLQQATGVSKAAITQSLIDKYGTPTDRFPATVLRVARGEQLVWGAASNDMLKTAGDITDISGGRHWQIEAVISEPEPGRTIALVQINDVPIGNIAGSTEAASGQIKF